CGRRSRRRRRMTTGVTVDVEAICERPLQLFVNGYNAWQHLREHALGMKDNGEERGWGLFLPPLGTALSAGELPDLRSAAMATSLDPDHPKLGPIYKQFLGCVKGGVERASRLDWFWENAAGTGSDSRWSTFCPEGIVGHLDDDVVRTGYLPEKDPSKWSAGAG